MHCAVRTPVARLTVEQEKYVAKAVVERVVREAFEEVISSWSFSAHAQKKDVYPKEPTTYYALRRTKLMKACPSDKTDEENKVEENEEKEKTEEEKSFATNLVDSCLKDAIIEINREMDEKNNDYYLNDTEESYATTYDAPRYATMKQIEADGFSEGLEEKEEIGVVRMEEMEEEQKEKEERDLSMSINNWSLRNEILDLNGETENTIADSNFDYSFIRERDATPCNAPRYDKNLIGDSYDSIVEENKEKNESSVGMILVDSSSHDEMLEIDQEKEVAVIDYDDSEMDEGDSIISEADSKYDADIDTEDIDEDKRKTREEIEENYKEKGHKSFTRGVKLRRSIQIATRIESNSTDSEAEVPDNRERIHNVDDANEGNDLKEADGREEIFDEISPHNGRLRKVLNRMKKIFCGLRFDSCFRCFKAAEADDFVVNELGENENYIDSTGSWDSHQ